MTLASNEFYMYTSIC